MWWCQCHNDDVTVIRWCCNDDITRASCTTAVGRSICTTQAGEAMVDEALGNFHIYMKLRYWAMEVAHDWHYSCKESSYMKQIFIYIHSRYVLTNFSSHSRQTPFWGDSERFRCYIVTRPMSGNYTLQATVLFHCLMCCSLNWSSKLTGHVWLLYDMHACIFLQYNSDVVPAFSCALWGLLLACTLFGLAFQMVIWSLTIATLGSMNTRGVHENVHLY